MEYSRILFDGNDNHILRHLPVNSKTILVARLVSMLVYMFFLSGCMSVIPLVIVCFWKGVMSGAFFIISVFLNTIFTLLFANLSRGDALYFRGEVPAGDELCSGGIDSRGGFELPVGRAVNL